MVLEAAAAYLSGSRYLIPLLKSFEFRVLDDRQVLDFTDLRDLTNFRDFTDIRDFTVIRDLSLYFLEVRALFKSFR